MPEEETGKWALERETIRLNARGEARTMEVVSCDDERLEVRE